MLHPSASTKANRSVVWTFPRMKNNVIVEWIVYVFVRTLICIVQCLTLQQAEELARLLAWWSHSVFRIRSRVVDENLRHAFPDLSREDRRQLAADMWLHLYLLGVEMLQATRKIHRSNWRNWITIPDDEKRVIVRRMLDRRALVVVTAHFGNFEISGYVAALLGFPTRTLARNLDNRFLDTYLKRVRESTGQIIYPARGTAELAQSVLETRGILALLGDQHAGPKGCWVQFFGRPASCHKSVAVFALANRVPLMVVLANRIPGKIMHFELRMMGLKDPLAVQADLPSVSELTQWYNDVLERRIRELPDQYWWLHRRWKDTRPARKGTSKVTSSEFDKQVSV
jgi:Kdo2-lipid IVA lauroyltransferase/acyltransferase